MRASWSNIPLGDLVEIGTGKLDSNQAEENGIYPFFTCAPDPLKINRFAFDCDAILLAGNNANGIFHLNRYVGKFNAYQRTYVITVMDKSRLSLDYLFYRLKTLTQKMGEYSLGTATKFLTMKILSPLSIPLPPLPEQRAIAHILGILDDKIELNRKMNQTLEEMARAIFKSWFVDFDPVRAKAEGREPVGMDADAAALFPDSFEDSELGKIPRGWKVVQLGKLIETVKGRSYKSEELSESDTALVTLKSFARGGGYRHDGLKSFTGTYNSEQVVAPGEIVLACTDVTQAAEVIGRPAIINEVGGYQTLVASLDTVIVRPHTPTLTRMFFYFLGRTEAFVAHTYAHTTGTTVLHLSKEALPCFEFALPPIYLVERFDSIANVAIGRIATLEDESCTLVALREALMPKLLSGEIRVKDAERFVEAAT